MREEVELKYILHAEAMGLSHSLALGAETVGGGKDVSQVSGEAPEEVVSPVALRLPFGAPEVCCAL